MLVGSEYAVMAVPSDAFQFLAAVMLSWLAVEVETFS